MRILSLVQCFNEVRECIRTLSWQNTSDQLLDGCLDSLLFLQTVHFLISQNAFLKEFVEHIERPKTVLKPAQIFLQHCLVNFFHFPAANHNACSYICIYKCSANLCLHSKINLHTKLHTSQVCSLHIWRMGQKWYFKSWTLTWREISASSIIICDLKPWRVTLPYSVCDGLPNRDVDGQKFWRLAKIDLNENFLIYSNKIPFYYVIHCL